MPRIKLDDITLEYEERGQGDALVLLHGLGSSAHDWDFQMPALAREYRVIAPSLRGFGASDKPDGPYTVMQYARDVIALLNELGIERAHVLGFSLGGAVAFQLAVQFEHRLKSLIVVNSQPSFELDHWRKYLMTLMRIGMANIMGMERMTRFLAKRMFPAPAQKALREQMLRRYRTNDKTAYLAALRALAGWSVEDLIDKVKLPTLVLAGEYDITPVDEKRAFAQKMPNAAVKVVADSRHGTPFDQHAIVNKLVLDFLATARANHVGANRGRVRRAQSSRGLQIVALRNGAPRDCAESR